MVEFKHINDAIDAFVNGSLQIYVGSATDAEILQLADILNEKTNVKPFDGTEYNKYLRAKRSSSYRYVTCSPKEHSVSSYDNPSHRKNTLTAGEVVELYLSEHNSFSESDFDSVF